MRGLRGPFRNSEGDIFVFTFCYVSCYCFVQFVRATHSYYVGRLTNELGPFSNGYKLTHVHSSKVVVESSLQKARVLLQRSDLRRIKLEKSVDKLSLDLVEVRRNREVEGVE